MAVGGSISMLISMPATAVVGVSAGSQAFCIGALAFDTVAIVVAPFLLIDLEPIEWDSVNIDDSNYSPQYGVYE